MHPIEHFCCQNSECPDAGIRGKGNLSFRGWSGKGKQIRMVYCRTCRAHFSERKGTVLEQCRLPPEKALSVLEHLRESCGTRATSRLVGVDKNTVTRYARMAGCHGEKLHDQLVAFSPLRRERSKWMRSGASWARRKPIATLRTLSTASKVTTGITPRSTQNIVSS